MGIYGIDTDRVQTAASVDFVTSNNTTWTDSVQFDPPPVPGGPPTPYWPQGASGPTWGFVGQNFRMDVKTNINASGPIASWFSTGVTGGQIVVDDPVQRILHMNVPESQYVTDGMVPGSYIYDFIMFDGATPPVRVMLMRGKFKLQAGVTGG
jgi:hypothetical protein